MTTSKPGVDVVEASIADLRSALEDGRVTSVGLVRAYRARMTAFDSDGPRLNAMVVHNPAAEDEARASDERRARGEALGQVVVVDGGNSIAEKRGSMDSAARVVG